MRLEHLYLIPWDIQDGTYLDFYNGRIDPRFSATMKGKPAEWDLEFVGDSFQLPLEGHGFLSQKDPLSERYFAQDRVVSHGYKISQCKDPELMMLFHFLIPILHPRKPSYIPVKWANTIIASWSGEREINWAFIMHKVTQDEVRALGPKKLCYLPSYLAQLYAYGDCQLVIERHHKVLVRRVIKEVYGTSEDELTNEEATYEETKEESTEASEGESESSQGSSDEEEKGATTTPSATTSSGPSSFASRNAGSAGGKDKEDREEEEDEEEGQGNDEEREEDEQPPPPPENTRKKSKRGRKSR
ncbi:unnamed protein product [Sphagnum jensenii]|uniref:Uncharacterized protein n=1 Tax=Sphagnum jensenii TaxID=128206 RepID=A0ABP0X7N4_9BRYO